jgi:hypothetical protein
VTNGGTDPKVRPAVSGRIVRSYANSIVASSLLSTITGVIAECPARRIFSASKRRSGVPASTVSRCHERLEAVALHVDRVDADVDQKLRSVREGEADRMSRREDRCDGATGRRDDGVSGGVDREARAHRSLGEHRIRNLGKCEHAARHRLTKLQDRRRNRRIQPLLAAARAAIAAPPTPDGSAISIRDVWRSCRHR